MKHSSILLLIILVACNNNTDQSFTDKSEAKNQTINGLKEGKWLEYKDKHGKVLTDTDNADYYVLTIYKADKPYGIAHKYYKSGKLQEETPYVDGKINGVDSMYNETGVLSAISTWRNDSMNGNMKNIIRAENCKWMLILKILELLILQYIMKMGR
jgi:antitoxin component YwqK of YwqJK toxin-antitoxin module